MIEQRANVILLCEDRRHRTFFHRMKAKHFKHLRIFDIPLPDGKKSGEQYVRNQYPLQVESIRNKSCKYFLVTIIDADTDSVEQHYRELDQELVKAGQKKRGDSDPIVIFIPKRNIETWIKCLSEEAEVSEEEDYKRKVQGDDLSKAVELFYSLSLLAEEKRPPYCPDSLTRAFPEMERLRNK